MAEGLSPAVRRAASESIVEVLARIHAVDLVGSGLDDLGRHEGYIERQLKRWYSQFEKSKTRDVPELDRVYQDLSSEVPIQAGATIVHGDYRLDNCMIGDDGQIMAVLDWELCTLGDPLADLGLLMVYWTDPDDVHPAGVSGATVLDGFLRRDDLLAATPRSRAATCRPSTTTWPSATGSWPASSRASTPATRAAPWATGATTAPSTSSGNRSSP